MCVIVLNPVGETISNSVIEQCWNRNKDGAGFAIPNPTTGKIRIYKELHNMDEFIRKYEKYVRNPKIEDKFNILLHFRIKTHGDVNEENIHPFRLNNGYVFAHNGTIRKVMPDKYEGKESDTVLFKKHILDKLEGNWIKNKSILLMMEEYINGSRLLFLSPKNDITILNEDLFTESDNLLFSNMLWKSYKNDSKSHRDGYRNNYDLYRDYEGWDFTNGYGACVDYQLPAETNQQNDLSNIDQQSVFEFVRLSESNTIKLKNDLDEEIEFEEQDNNTYKIKSIDYDIAVTKLLDDEILGKEFADEYLNKDNSEFFCDGCYADLDLCEYSYEELCSKCTMILKNAITLNCEIDKNFLPFKEDDQDKKTKHILSMIN